MHGKHTLFASTLVPAALLLAGALAGAQTAPAAVAAQPAPASIAGTWDGTAQAGSQTVPFHLQISGNGDHVQGAFLNGPERSPSSSGSYHDGALELNFNYYLNKLSATVAGNELTGTFGGYSRPVTLTAHRHIDAPQAASAAAVPQIAGEWEIAVPRRPKGEPAWRLQVKQQGAEISAVILRIDGDTGTLYGSYSNGAFELSKFTADGPASLRLEPQADGTLNVIQRAGRAPLVARRPEAARVAGLPGPDDPTQHTTLSDPSQPLTFRFPDLNGHIVSNTDPQFKNKVVIVAIGGSWCPNCHDEAPFLAELYRRFHRQGLEIVELSFEEQSQLANPTRLRAFIARYRIPYTVLLAGNPDDLNAKLPQVVNLNCWPTTFFIGRDGLVKAIHAGYAGPATPENAELRRDVDQLVGTLLAAK